MKPKVSIIIPVYNVEQYLPKCIESCVNQTLKEIEIILVNDGSTDNSGKICDEYAANHSNIKVMHITNAGVSNARNIGIIVSTGEYIMFLDSDDWIDLETCETAYNTAINTGAEIVFWSWQKESVKGSCKDFYLEKNSYILLNNDVDKLRIRCIGLLYNELNDPVKTDHFNTIWAKLYKKSFIIKSNVKFIERNKVGMEDVLFNIYVFQQVSKITYIPSYFYHYRLDNRNSLTKVDVSDLSNKFYNLFDSIEKIIKNKPRFMEAFNNRISLSLINIMLSIASYRNSNSFKSKVQETQVVLDNVRFRKALKNLRFKALPFHWKIFFFFCKYRFAFGVYLMSIGMRQLRKVKK